MVQVMLVNLEIAFWKAAIPLMRESPLVQTTLQRILPLVQSKETMRLLAQIIALISAGLVLGFGIGLARLILAAR